ATALFTPWSGGAAAERRSNPEHLQITSGPNGGPCQSEGPLPFAPGIQAGSTNNQAAAFTPFTLTIKHPDGQQALESITIHLPPGLAALISQVTPCPEER